MRLLHLGFGLVLFVLFLHTGRHLSATIPEVIRRDERVRFIKRANHIYIMGTALVHVALGLYLRRRPHRLAYVLQTTGSVVLLVGGAIVYLAFWLNTDNVFRPDIAKPDRLLTLLGMVGMAAGIGLHLLAGLPAALRRDGED